MATVVAVRAMLYRKDSGKAAVAVTQCKCAKYTWYDLVLVCVCQAPWRRRPCSRPNKLRYKVSHIRRGLVILQCAIGTEHIGHIRRGLVILQCAIGREHILILFLLELIVEKNLDSLVASIWFVRLLFCMFCSWDDPWKWTLQDFCLTVKYLPYRASALYLKRSKLYIRLLLKQFFVTGGALPQIKRCISLLIDCVNTALTLLHALSSNGDAASVQTYWQRRHWV